MEKSNQISRRSLLKGLTSSGALLAGLSLTGCGTKRGYIPGDELFAVPLEPVFGSGVRKNAHHLNTNSDDVQMYREAVGWMRARSDRNVLDPMGWAQHWAHHSLFCATNTFQYQVHYGWFFLPWHRAYLSNLEQKIRRTLNEPSFALPYWDWTRHPTIPEWYFGEGNPLNNKTRYQGPDDVVPADFLDVGPSLRAKQWAHFGGKRRNPGDLQVEGTLEQSCHNCVHNWIGGEMASFDGAGNDPIFQSHHGQIDRLWESWLAKDNTNPDDERWLQHHFWFYGPNGTSQIIQMRDLLTPEALGYSYDSLDYDLTLTPENTPVMKETGQELGAVGLSDAELAKVEIVARGEGPGRVSVVYERLSLPIHPFHHRLFFVSESGEATYIGTHNILPIPDLNRGLEGQVSSQVEVRHEALDALLKGGRVKVIGVPVALKGRPAARGPVPFRNVSLTVEA